MYLALVGIGCVCAGIIIGVFVGPAARIIIADAVSDVKKKYAEDLALVKADATAAIDDLRAKLAKAEGDADDAKAAATTAQASLTALQQAIQPVIPFPASTAPVAAAPATPVAPETPTPGGAIAATPTQPIDPPISLA